MFKKISFLVLLFAVASCDKFSTHGKFITEQKDAWMDGYTPGGHPYYPAIDRDSASDRGLVYCRANAKEDGTAKPVCYKPKFE